MPEPLLTPGQFAAAQMLMARMIAESSGEEFKFSDIGMTWISADDRVCAVQDDGNMIRVGDVIYAAIVMLWSTLLERSQSSGEEMSLILSRMGISLAFHDPSSLTS